jgi:hypothetical protein
LLKDPQITSRPSKSHFSVKGIIFPVNICDDCADKLPTKICLCEPEVDDSFKIHGGGTQHQVDRFILETNTQVVSYSKNSNGDEIKSVGNFTTTEDVTVSVSEASNGGQEWKIDKATITEMGTSESFMKVFKETKMNYGETGIKIMWEKIGKTKEFMTPVKNKNMNTISPEIMGSYQNLQAFVRYNNAGLGIRANEFNVPHWSARNSIIIPLAAGWYHPGAGTAIGLGMSVGEMFRPEMNHKGWGRQIKF